MLVSQILTQSRKLANDTDSSNPFASDTEFYTFITDWLQEVAMEYGYPHKTDTVAYAVGEGGAADADNIDIDIQTVILVNYEPTGGTPYRLMPRTEAEMAAQDANWRSASNGTPSYYIIQDTETAGTNELGPQRTITTDRPVSIAGTMRIYALQIPAVLAAGTNSPIYSAALHKSAVYYVTAQMLLPINIQKADYFLKLHHDKLRRCKTLLQKTVDSATQIWDRQDDNSSTADRLTR